MRRNKQTSGERIVKDIKRKTRKQYSAEEKSVLYWMVYAVKKVLLSCAPRAKSCGVLCDGKECPTFLFSDPIMS